MKRGVLWGIAVGIAAFFGSILLHSRALVMNVGGILAPVLFLVGIVVLLRGASFDDGLATRDDAKSERRLGIGVWLVSFSIPLLIIAFLCWGLWPMPHA